MDETRPLTQEEERGLRLAWAERWGVHQYLGPLLATLDAERAKVARLREELKWSLRDSDAQIADLKARLREVRALSAPGMGRDDIARVADLRVKSWRGP